MVKYVAVASLLKLFSCSLQTKALYRLLGNLIGAKRRTDRGLPRSYIDRALLLLDKVRKYDCIHPDDRLLEIGTGWVHWESIFLRLFFKVNVILFDVWDNRQLKALKRYFAEFAEVVDNEIDMTPIEYESVHNLLLAVVSTRSFNELYRMLGFDYVIEPNGTLWCFQDDSFNHIFSANVLEHINEDILPEYVQSFQRLLKPGGYSIHTIDLGDHLSYYDQNASVKNYLRYSDTAWKRYFQNEVQYFNRVQRSEWLNLFRRAGLKLIEEDSVCSNIGAIPVDKKYQNLDSNDLNCTELRVVHRK